MTYHWNDTYKSYKCILRPVALVISFFYKISYIWFLRSFFSDSLRSSTYSVETFCNCTALGTCFLSLGGTCVFHFFLFVFFLFNKIFVLIPKFSFFQGCWLTGCLNCGSCVYDKKGHLFSCLCKIPWTGKKCENKNGKICFTFLSWKGRTIVIKKTVPL